MVHLIKVTKIWGTFLNIELYTRLHSRFYDLINRSYQQIKALNKSVSSLIQYCGYKIIRFHKHDKDYTFAF